MDANRAVEARNKDFVFGDNLNRNGVEESCTFVATIQGEVFC